FIARLPLRSDAAQDRGAPSHRVRVRASFRPWCGHNEADWRKHDLGRFDALYSCAPCEDLRRCPCPASVFNEYAPDENTPMDDLSAQITTIPWRAVRLVVYGQK